jgi:3-hydroxymyristoyl/3-hydroxydecanoyl-(acyl carrier protein) dehydratase
MMAQAAGKCLDAENTNRGKAMLSRIKFASFHAWVRPDEKAVIEASIISSHEQFATAACFISVNDRKVCKSELFFSFAPNDLFADGYIDEVLEAYMNKRTITME